MLFFLQQQVFITYKRNYLTIISDNLSQMGFISYKIVLLTHLATGKEVLTKVQLD